MQRYKNKVEIVASMSKMVACNVLKRGCPKIVNGDMYVLNVLNDALCMFVVANCYAFYISVYQRDR